MSRCRASSTVPIGIILIAAFVFAQPKDAWEDASPHRVQVVTVSDGVQIEVLDWGGAGPPVVLLAGYLTAHVYDRFAPRLSEFAHVYGITRRGLGASSHTDSGYGARQSAADVVAVLDQLDLVAPVLAGHSFGGQDLTNIATDYADRVSGLIYLNSSENPKLKLTDYGATPPDPQSLPAAIRNPPPPDKSSFSAYAAWQRATQGIAFPEAELRWLYALNPDGTLGNYLVSDQVREAMYRGVVEPEYSRIHVPVLAFFATPPDIGDLASRYKPETPNERLALEQKRAFDLAVVRRHIRDLRAGDPSARIVEVPGANFYIFLSDESLLVEGIRSFLATMPDR